MAKHSAGILMYRRRGRGVELLLVHPGGPLWARKDAWSLPKGLVEEEEDLLAAARREFEEETGFAAVGDPVPLGDFLQPGGKLVSAWAIEGDCDPAALRSNLFTMEWPPRSGRMASFPEVDRAGWFAPRAAVEKLMPGQRPIVEALLKVLALDEGAA